MARKRTLLKNLRLDEVSLVNVPANQEAHTVIIKAHAVDHDDEAEDSTDPGVTTKGHSAEKEDDTMNLEELTKALETAEATLSNLQKSLEEKDAEIARLTKAVEDAGKVTKGDQGGEDEVLKGLPEEVRKRFEDLEKANKAAMDRLTKMQEDQEAGEFVSKAATFSGLPVKAADLGALLFRVAKGRSNAVDAAELDRVLTAANTAALEKGLTAPVGKPGNVAKAGSAEALINAKADELRKADASLSKQQAITKAIEADPELYSKYREELGMGG